MIKRAIVIILIVVISLILLGVIIILIAPPLSENPDKDVLIDFFRKNRSMFDNITNNMKTVKEDFSFDKSNEKKADVILKVSTKDGVKPYDIPKEIREDVKKVLTVYGFKGIYKISNWIYFDKFTGFQWHQALVYSTDGTPPPLHRERDFAEIGDGWYYYNGE